MTTDADYSAEESAFLATKDDYKWRTFLAAIYTLGLSISSLEKTVVANRDAKAQRLAAQRLADNKNRAVLSAEQEAHRLEIVKREMPYRRIEQPKGWAKKDWFTIDEKTGTLNGQCDCGHQFHCIIQPDKDVWWELTHRHRWLNAKGEETAAGTKIGGSVGSWLDRLAMAYAFVHPNEPPRLSDHPPEEFRLARPMI